jgi:hypothetical protein
VLAATRAVARTRRKSSDLDSAVDTAAMPLKQPQRICLELAEPPPRASTWRQFSRAGANLRFATHPSAGSDPTGRMLPRGSTRWRLTRGGRELRRARRSCSPRKQASGLVRPSLFARSCLRPGGGARRTAAGRSLRHESDRPGTPGGVIAIDGTQSRGPRRARDRFARLAIV